MSHPLLHFFARCVFLIVMAAVIALAGWPLWRDRSSSTRRKRVNVWSVLSVLFLLLAFFVAGVAQATLHYVQFPENRFRVGCALLVLLSISVTAAVLGLAQLSRRSWQTGRRRARAVLGTVFLCFCGLLASTWRTVVAPPQEAQAFLSRHLNFRFAIDKPWTRVRARTLDPEAVLGLRQSNRAMAFTVAAKLTGAESTLTTRALADSVIARQAQRQGNAETREETPMKLHDLEGLLLESSAQVKEGSLLYFTWVTAGRGAAYQLTMSAPASLSHARMRDEAIALFQNFELLRAPREQESAVAKDYHSLRSGYSVKLAGTVWNRPIGDLYRGFPSAEFVIGGPGNSMFAVIPLPLSGCDPEVELLSHVFLWRIGVESLGECVFDLHRTTHGPLQGVAFQFERSAIPGFLYRAEVLKGNGFGYLLLGCTEKVSGVQKQLGEVFQTVEFDPMPEQPKPSLFTTRERLFCTSYLRDLGREYLKLGRFATACTYFQTAQRLDPEPDFYVQNAADGLMEAGSYHAALSYLSAAEKAEMPQTGRILIRTAWLHQQAGDVAAALKSYRAAFSGDFRDDYAFADYLRLLARENRADEALTLADSYVAKQDAVEVRLAQAEILTTRKEYPAALKLLQKQDESHPGENNIGFAVARTLAAAGRPADALEQCDKLLKIGFGSASVRFLKGTCEFELKRYPEAKTTLETVLKLDPANPEIRRLLEKVSGGITKNAEKNSN